MRNWGVCLSFKCVFVKTYGDTPVTPCVHVCVLHVPNCLRSLRTMRTRQSCRPWIVSFKKTLVTRVSRCFQSAALPEDVNRLCSVSSFLDSGIKAAPSEIWMAEALRGTPSSSQRLKRCYISFIYTEGKKRMILFPYVCFFLTKITHNNHQTKNRLHDCPCTHCGSSLCQITVFSNSSHLNDDTGWVW